MGDRPFPSCTSTSSIWPHVLPLTTLTAGERAEPALRAPWSEVHQGGLAVQLEGDGTPEREDKCIRLIVQCTIDSASPLRARQ
mmetsp:Transcript_20561/g.53133  ORF Transcript_20561/g.53133 Transcript_20561/m.53133 type:complete len:83 (+) Transcript_20561:877-1125(+)